VEFTIGEKVKLKSTGEVGVIVWFWEDGYGAIDAYIAFFGDKFPHTKPKEKPYILRYYTSSLEKYNKEINYG
jgi:hypothetical protein